jgi:hypothetical protein
MNNVQQEIFGCWKPGMKAVDAAGDQLGVEPEDGGGDPGKYNLQA